MGTLNVYYQSGTGARTLAWSRSGDQGDQWNYVEVEIPSVSSLRVTNLHVFKIVNLQRFCRMKYKCDMILIHLSIYL